MPTRTLHYTGPFSLAAGSRFLEGFAPARYRGARPDDLPTLRLAFVVDGTDDVAAVTVTQDRAGVVSATIDAGNADAAAQQIERILSLDIDGSGFPDVGRRDPVVGTLIERYAGLRPVCFLSPYEAACWAVIGHRIRIAQAATLKERIAETFGTVLEIDGAPVSVFPAPSVLAAVSDDVALPQVKRDRLRGIAEAALAGGLDATALRAVETDEALTLLQKLPGIGPFSAELILIRGCGAPDVFPTVERRLHESMRELYDEADAGLPRLREIAEQWRPFRSWASLLIRAFREETTGEIGGRMS